MYNVGNDKIQEHGSQQAEKGKAHTKAFVLFLQEFIAHQHARKGNDQQERRQRTATLEITDHQCTEQAAEQELDCPGKTGFPYRTPFPVQKTMMHHDSINGNCRRFVADSVGNLLSLVLGSRFKFFRNFFDLGLGFPGGRRARSRLNPLSFRHSSKTFLSPTFRVVQLSRQQNHQNKGTNIVRQKNQQVRTIDHGAEGNGIPTETRQKSDSREKLFNPLDNGVRP